MSTNCSMKVLLAYQQIASKHLPRRPRSACLHLQAVRFCVQTTNVRDNGEDQVHGVRAPARSHVMSQEMWDKTWNTGFQIQISPAETRFPPQISHTCAQEFQKQWSIEHSILKLFSHLFANLPRKWATWQLICRMNWDVLLHRTLKKWLPRGASKSPWFCACEYSQNVQNCCAKMWCLQKNTERPTWNYFMSFFSNLQINVVLVWHEGVTFCCLFQQRTAVLKEKRKAECVGTAPNENNFAAGRGTSNLEPAEGYSSWSKRVVNNNCVTETMKNWGAIACWFHCSHTRQ